jgi:hypothetical protein
MSVVGYGVLGMVRLVKRWLHALQRWTYIDSDFTFRVPYLITFLFELQVGQVGNFGESMSSNVVGSDLLFFFFGIKR